MQSRHCRRSWIALVLANAPFWWSQSCAQGYGGSIKFGNTVLRGRVGGAFDVTPDTPISATAFHVHGVLEAWVRLHRVGKAKVARDGTGPKELSGTFTLREKFRVTKPGTYSFMVRGYQMPVPGVKPARYLGPRPFVVVQATLNVRIPEAPSFEKRRDGWEASGPGAGRGSLDWQMVRATFNSGSYRHLAVLLINGSNGPLAWFDDVEIEGLEIVNPGFEELSGPDRLVGWEGRLWLPWSAKYHSLKEPLHLFASPEHHRGRRSLQVTAPLRDAFLVRQRVACEPHTDYTVRGWMRSVPMGRGRIEIHGLRPGEALENVRSGQHIDQSVKPCVDHRLVRLGAPPALTDLGDKVIEIRAPGAKMRKRFAVVPHMPFMVDADVVVQSSPDRLFYGITQRRFPYQVPTEAEKATAIVRVLDPAASLLAEATTDVSTPIALPMRVKGFAGAAKEVVVELTKAGGGVVRFGNVELGPPDATVSIRSAKWDAKSSAFVLPKQCAYWIDPKIEEKSIPSSPDLGVAIGMLEQETGGQAEFVPVDAGRPSSLTIALDDRIAGSEDYRITIGRTGVNVTASTVRGAFYALVTVLDLVMREEGRWLVPGGAIDDGPDLPVRWFRCIGMVRDLAKARILARLKLNGGIPSGSDHLIAQTGTKPYVRRRDDVLATVEAARSYGIDYVPFIQNTGHAEASELWIDPNVAEGTAIEGEELVLRGEAPTPLKNGNVIQTESSRIELRSADRVVYEAGRDFRVIAQLLKFPFFYRAHPATKPPAVVRTKKSRIPDGGAVVASYDYVARHPYYTRVFSRCLTEPRGHAMVRQYLETVLTKLTPARYVHLAHDEAMTYCHLGNGKWTWQVTCRRCRRSGLSFEELLAANVNRLVKEAKALSPETDVIIWADMMRDPEHDRTSMEILKHLSRDVILLPWYYGRSRHELGAVEGWRDIAVFSRMGFRSIGAPGMFNIENVRGWCQAGREARRRGWPFMGVMFYAGGGYQGKGAIGIPAAGRFSWRVPEGWKPPAEPKESAK